MKKLYMYMSYSMGDVDLARPPPLFLVGWGTLITHDMLSDYLHLCDSPLPLPASNPCKRFVLLSL